MRYTREDYEHRNCLAVTRTESSEFVKCLTHAGDPDDYEPEESSKLDRFNNERDNPDQCDKCGMHMIHTDNVPEAFKHAELICQTCLTNVDLAPVRIDNVTGEIR